VLLVKVGLLTFQNSLRSVNEMLPGSLRVTRFSAGCPVLCGLPDSDKFVEDLRAISLNIYEFCKNCYNWKRTVRKSVNETYFLHLSSCFDKIHYRGNIFHEILNVNGATRSVIGICWTWCPSNRTHSPRLFEAVNNQ
jgi:hypothetical protein